MTPRTLLATWPRRIQLDAPRGVFNAELLDERPGMLTLRISGDGALLTFASEPGGHRHQRVPPTERNGRVHTSTVTVAVMQEPTEKELKILDKDLEWGVCRGSGAGGQHRNVTNSAVQLTHKPSKLMVRVESERSQKQNRDAALSLLRAKLKARMDEEEAGAVASNRKKQVGSGQRGDKVKTYRWQDDLVTDHVNETKTRLSAWLKGE